MDNILVRDGLKEEAAEVVAAIVTAETVAVAERCLKASGCSEQWWRQGLWQWGYGAGNSNGGD